MGRCGCACMGMPYAGGMYVLSRVHDDVIK